MHCPSRLKECEVTVLYTKGHKKEDTAPTLQRGSDFICLFIGDDCDLSSTESLPDKEQGSHGFTVWAWTQHQERVLVLSDQKVATLFCPCSDTEVGPAGCTLAQSSCFWLHLPCNQNWFKLISNILRSLNSQILLIFSASELVR